MMTAALLFAAAVAPYVIAKTRDKRQARTIRVVENRAKRGSWIALIAAGGLRIATAVAARTTIPARIRSRPRRPRIFARKGRGLYTGCRERFRRQRGAAKGSPSARADGSRLDRRRWTAGRRSPRP